MALHPVLPVLIRRSASRRIALGNPLSSSSLGDEKRVSSLVLRSAARDPILIATLRVAADRTEQCL
jgi:hypothetical protein